MNHLGPVPDLGVRPPQIIIRERRVLSPASCELRDGGATIDGCDVHLEIIDVIAGVMYLVPISKVQSECLAGALDNHAVQHARELGEERSSHERN